MSKVLKADSYRALGRPLFWLCLFLFVLSRTATAMPEYLTLVRQFGNYSVAQSCGYLYYSGYYLISAVNVFAVSVSCLPFGMSYLEDRQSDFDRSFISRTSIRRYSLSKFLVNALSTILVSFCGFLLTIALFVLLCGGEAGHFMMGSYSNELANSLPWLYMLLLAFFSALYCALWSSIVLVISAYLNNLYLILALTYLGITITSYLHFSRFGFPMFSNLAMQGAWLAVSDFSPWLASGLNLLQYSFLYSVLFFLFWNKVKKNYERKG